MGFLSYLLTYGPQLLTNLIAWIGAALAFVAGIMAWRSARNDRSALVAATLQGGGPGGPRLEVVNVGGRFALDVMLMDAGDVLLARHGGVAGGSTVWLTVPEDLGSVVELRLRWTDADGRDGASATAFERTSESWERSLR